MKTVGQWFIETFGIPYECLKWDPWENIKISVSTVVCILVKIKPFSRFDFILENLTNNQNLT